MLKPWYFLVVVFLIILPVFAFFRYQQSREKANSVPLSQEKNTPESKATSSTITPGTSTTITTKQTTKATTSKTTAKTKNTAQPSPATITTPAKLAVEPSIIIRTPEITPTPEPSATPQTSPIINPTPPPTPAPATVPPPPPAPPAPIIQTTQETYPNQQNINFSAFPTLSSNDFSGATISISPGQAIEDAMISAKPGDKILLKAGTYTVADYISINKSIYIGAENNGTVTVNIPAGDNNRGVQIEADKVMLEGITLNINRTAGIGLYKSKDIVLKNVNLTMTAGGYTEGIVAYDSNNGLLLDGVKVNNAEMGVSCNSSACTNWKLNNVKITNKTSSSGSGADCFAIENGQNIFLKNLEVTRCSADGIDIKGTNVLLLNPLVHNLNRNGIKLWKGGDIINATVNDTGADVAVYLGYTGTSRLINSTISNHSGSNRSYVLAADYDDSANAMYVEIINSTINQSAENNGAIIHFSGINGGTRTLVIKNSTFSKINGQVELEEGTAKYFTDPANNNTISLGPAS